MTKTKWLYRLENSDPEKGLWYNEKSEFVFDIGKVPGCKTKELPMDWNDRYHKNGKTWYASCEQKEDLLHWFSVEDALYLMRKGYSFVKYLATEYVVYDKEVIFVKETCKKRVPIDITEVFPEVKHV